MTVDNELYNAPGDIWWDEDKPLSSLRTAINPARVGYLQEVLRRLEIRPAGGSALDVGCGGGLMAEEVARLGFKLTGVDPAPAAIEVGRSHAEGAGLAIDYHVASGESLPFPDDCFDLVYCCDVLEHVSDLPGVIAESARVLRPGGLYFFDTVNRTRASRLLMIKLFQEWALTAWMPPNLHSWDRFIKPGELMHLLESNCLHVGEVKGMAPTAPPPRLLIDLLRLRRGAISFGEFGRRSAFKAVADTSVLYAGYAVKQ